MQQDTEFDELFDEDDLDNLLELDVIHLEEEGLYVGIHKASERYEIAIADDETSHIVEVVDEVETARQSLGDWVMLLSNGLSRVYDVKEGAYRRLVPQVVEKDSPSRDPFAN